MLIGGLLSEPLLLSSVDTTNRQIKKLWFWERQVRLSDRDAPKTRITEAPGWLLQVLLVQWETVSWETSRGRQLDSRAKEGSVPAARSQRLRHGSNPSVHGQMSV